MTRKLVNLRLPPELIAAVDARAEELGQTRTKFVERALESALRVPPLDSLGPNPPAALVKAAAEESMRQEFVEGALERVETARPVSVPGVRPAREFVLDPRQAALNRAKKS